MADDGAMDADDPGIDAVLGGLDGPRPLPPGLADRVAAAVTAHAGDVGLVGADHPRPLPSEVRASLVAALDATAAPAPAPGPAPVGWYRRRPRVVAAAAAVVLLAGVTAAATRSTDGPATEVASPGGDGRPVGGPDGGSTSTTGTDPGVLPGGPGPGAGPIVAMAESAPAYARLESFGTCDDLLAWVRTRAEEAVTEYGLADVGSPGFLRDGPIPFGDVAEGGAGPAASAPPAGRTSGHSVTNVQEAGIDEPDVLKVDDRALYFLNATYVAVVPTDGSTAPSSIIPTTTSAVTDLVLDGDRLGLFQVGGAPDEPASSVRVVDVADLAAPTDVATVPIPGWIADGRVVDGVLHVVSSWQPGPFPFTYPADQEPATIEGAREANRQIVRDSTLDQWLPPGVDCAGVRHPRDVAGFGSTVVTSIPLDDPAAATTTAVVADADLVYASGDRLVVATMRFGSFRPVEWSARTNLHRFALDPDGARYEASGSVPGYLRSSYSLSEHDGFLRVASTDQPMAQDGTAPAESSSTVTVLAEEEGDGAGVLVPVGSVGGLGVGQQIQGVRFVGDVAYVVTFLRTDPLYTIDLSDPTEPRVRGALEVTGFSGYLHPLDDGLLLGVGVEADPTSGVPVGAAVSIYDVGDLDHPTLTNRHVTAGANYLATDEPHAFLLWEPTGQLVLPAYSFDPMGFEAAVFRIVGDRVELQGSVRHTDRPTYEGPLAPTTPNPFPAVMRSAMAGGRLYTLSSSGVLVSDPDSLADVAWVPLPQPGLCCVG